MPKKGQGKSAVFEGSTISRKASGKSSGKAARAPKCPVKGCSTALNETHKVFCAKCKRDVCREHQFPIDHDCQEYLDARNPDKAKLAPSVGIVKKAPDNSEAAQIKRLFELFDQDGARPVPPPPVERTRPCPGKPAAVTGAWALARQATARSTCRSTATTAWRRSRRRAKRRAGNCTGRRSRCTSC